jgi:hypothetical protein
MQAAAVSPAAAAAAPAALYFVCQLLVGDVVVVVRMVRVLWNSHPAFLTVTIRVPHDRLTRQSSHAAAGGSSASS